MSEHQIAWGIVTMLQTNDCRTVPRRFRRRIIPAAEVADPEPGF